MPIQNEVATFGKFFVPRRAGKSLLEQMGVYTKAELMEEFLLGAHVQTINIEGVELKWLVRGEKRILLND